MSDDRPKSAYELALEKLKQRDRDRGETAPASLTDGQKKKIAAFRQLYEARLAEREILHRSERARLLSDPEGAEKLEKLEEGYLKDRRRIEEQREKAIEAARAGSPGAPRKRSSGPKAKVLVAALGLGLLAASRAAALLGREKELGRVAPGYVADLVAVKGNPLDDIELVKTAGFVMAGGVIRKNDFGTD